MEWRGVVDFEDLYEVSSFGHVRNSRTGKILAQNHLPNGYLTVAFCRNAKMCRQLSHKVVADAFLGLRPAGLQVNHKDGVKDNNRAENLEYVTRLENMRHALRMGLLSPVNLKLRKLSDDQIADIRRLRATHRLRELAVMFDVHMSHVSNLCTMKRRAK